MSELQQLVLDWKLALHNWRKDPSAANTRAVILAGELVCGNSLALEKELALTIEVNARGGGPNA